jgi:hypothetical protein
MRGRIRDKSSVVISYEVQEVQPKLLSTWQLDSSESLVLMYIV